MRVWQLFESDGSVKLGVLSEHFRHEGRLDRRCVVELIDRAKDILMQEPNVLPITDPVTGTRASHPASE